MKSMYIYGGILVVSLGAAWAQWKKDPSLVSGEEVVVLYGDADKLESLVWDSEKHRIDLSLKSDEQGSYLWADYTDKKKDKENQKQFKVGEEGTKLLENLSPFVAIRKLNDVDEAKREDLGLKDPKTTLTISRKGKTHTYHIGSEAYGTKDIYLEDQESKTIFLVDDAKVRSLKFGRTKLPDRRLWSFKKDTITHVYLTTIIDEESKTLHFENKNWQDKKNAKWIDADNPNADNKQLTNWITKMLRSTNSEYTFGLDESTLTPAFQLKIEANNQKAEEVSIFHTEKKTTWYGQVRQNCQLIPNLLPLCS